MAATKNERNEILFSDCFKAFRRRRRRRKRKYRLILISRHTAYLLVVSADFHIIEECWWTVGLDGDVWGFECPSSLIWIGFELNKNMFSHAPTPLIGSPERQDDITSSQVSSRWCRQIIALLLIASLSVCSRVQADATGVLSLASRLLQWQTSTVQSEIEINRIFH